MEKGMTPESIQTYLGLLRGLLTVLREDPGALMLPAEWQWSDIDRRALEIYLNDRIRKKRWSPNTQALNATALRSFFGFLVSRGHMERNPARSLKPRLPRRNLGVPAGDEEAVRAMFKDTPGGVNAVRRQLLLELLYGAMLRPSQVYHLRDMELSPREGQARLRLDGGDLEIPLSPEGIARARAYQEERQRMLTGGEVPGAPAFWIDSRGRACTPARLAREVRRAMEAAGLEGGPRELRLLAARHFRERGGDTRSLRRLLGAKRLGDLDRYGPKGFMEVARIVRRIHPRGEVEPEPAPTPEKS